jgi:hypothetical protein
MPTWTIYCHTHIISERRYIGLTKKTMLQRWNQHIANAKSKRGKGCLHLWNAIRKYGPEAFSHEVLEICNSLEEANEAEKTWINKFDSRNPEKGFNLALGGDHTPHPIRKNPWDNPEFRAKQMVWLSSPKYKEQAASQARLLWKDPKFRALFDDPEFRAEISAGSKSLWQNPEFRARLKPICLKPIEISAKTFQEIHKRCPKCEKNGKFGIDRSTKTGFKYICKDCEKRDRIAKRESRKVRGKIYREAHQNDIKQYQTTYYAANRNRIINRDRHRRSDINHTNNIRKQSLIDMVNQIKLSPCNSCHEKSDPSFMDFFPKDYVSFIQNKGRSIDWRIRHNYSKQRILEEIQRCDLVCRNCYRLKVSQALNVV